MKVRPYPEKFGFEHMPIVVGLLWMGQLMAALLSTGAARVSELGRANNVESWSFILFKQLSVVSGVEPEKKRWLPTEENECE